jgi:hypothetical protein
MKKEVPNLCPVCGGNSWMATTLGTMCKNCSYVYGSAPVIPKDKE